MNFGEDVTANAKVISDVKKKLKDKPEYLEIRGEVYMKKDGYKRQCQLPLSGSGGRCVGGY